MGAVTPETYRMTLHYVYIYSSVGRNSVVGAATRYGLGGEGNRIPVTARFSAPIQTGPRAHSAPYAMGNLSLSGR